jgi:hypothetical protein
VTRGRFCVASGTQLAPFWHHFGAKIAKIALRRPLQNHLDFYCVFPSIFESILDSKQVRLLSRGDPFGHPNPPPGLVWGLRAPSWAQSTNLEYHFGPPAPMLGPISVVVGSLLRDSGCIFGDLSTLPSRPQHYICRVMCLLIFCSRQCRSTEAFSSPGSVLLPAGET